MKQLDLLTWKPTCTVVVFPLPRRRALVKTTAETLLSRHGNAAVTYWRSVCRRLSEELARAGISLEARNIELRAFHDAVQGEMYLLGLQSRRPGGGDAA